MRFSKLFAPTTKDAPKDALLPSHIFLIRGGFISQVGSGIYNFLPLGKIVLDKIKNVVKQELDCIDAQETQLGFITPSELWKESGRYDKFGKELLRFKDRKSNEFVLGPTHEEAMVDLVRSRVKSYKQLPLNLYQINIKFRDEARPRYGLLRGREFLMKDGYSFHEDEEDLKREFSKMQLCYENILKRLGLEYRVVDADSGAIGGSGSKEIMVLADNGEDDIVVCEGCDYAANIEAAKRKKPDFEKSQPKQGSGKIHTPDLKTIEEISSFLEIKPSSMVKAVVKKAIYSDNEEIVLFFIRGCDVLQETKALSACGAIEFADISENELDNLGIDAGFIGPNSQKLKMFVDLELSNEKDFVCGANEKDYHISGFSFVDKNFEYVDLIMVQEGDLCSCCGRELKITKGIEVGHIFMLGDTYSKALNATFLDRNGKAKPYIMGTYGMGISRLVAVMIEQHHDEKGCLWSKESTPFALSIIVSNVKDKEQLSFAQTLYEKLQNAGVEVLLDDRAERFGFKMSDFELLGFPKAVIVGKGLATGEVQIVDRKTLEKTSIEKDKIFDKLMEI